MISGDARRDERGEDAEDSKDEEEVETGEGSLGGLEGAGEEPLTSWSRLADAAIVEVTAG